MLNCHVILCIQIWFLYLHKLYLLCFCMKNHSVPFSTFSFGQLIICNFLNGLYLVEIVLYSLLFWKHFKVTIWSLFYFVFSFLCSFFIFLLVLRMELRASYQVNHSNRCMAFYFFRKILTFRTSSQLNNFPDFFFLLRLIKKKKRQGEKLSHEGGHCGLMEPSDFTVTGIWDNWRQMEAKMAVVRVEDH